MKNMLVPAHEARLVVIVAGAAYLSGAVVPFAGGYGFAQMAVASGAKVTLMLGGQHRVTKTTAETWVAGTKVYWDPGTSKWTNVAGALTKGGYIRDAAGAGVTTGVIVLTEPPGV